jgi:hypothetical protein
MHADIIPIAGSYGAAAMGGVTHRRHPARSGGNLDGYLRELLFVSNKKASCVARFVT